MMRRDEPAYRIGTGARLDTGQPHLRALRGRTPRTPVCPGRFASQRSGAFPSACAAARAAASAAQCCGYSKTTLRTCCHRVVVSLFVTVVSAPRRRCPRRGSWWRVPSSARRVRCPRRWPRRYRSAPAYLCPRCRPA